MSTDDLPYVPNVDDVEQQAESAEDPSEFRPRGENRDSTGFIHSRGGFDENGRKRVRSWRVGTKSDSDTDIESVPAAAKEEYRRYYLEFAITQSALRTFDDLVLEPDWEVTAKVNDEVDEDMTDALNLWGQHCAIRAGEPGHDLSNILSQCPSGRRAKPAVIIEKIGTVEDPEAIAGLQLLEPWNMSARFVPNQNMIIQPGHDVGRDHPMVERNGKQVPAAYVQYDDEQDSFASSSDSDQIPFAQDDLLKLTYDPPDGSAWGRTIWSSLAEPIDRLKQKLRDRDAAIRLTGHPHRIYSSDAWTKEEAKQYADAHDEGQMSAWDIEDEANKKSYAGRVDYVPHTVNVQVVEGEVADISDAVKDDLEQIFSILPVSKHNIAYVDEINQFVVDPLDANDDRRVDKERRYLEGKFSPLFAEKADELADDEYPGEVEFHIRQPESDNPLERSDFEPERVADLVGAFTEYVKSGASTEFPRELPYFFAGMSRETFEDEYAEEPIDPNEATDADDGVSTAEVDDAAEVDIDEDDPDVQSAAAQMGLLANGSAEPDAEQESESAD